MKKIFFTILRILISIGLLYILISRLGIENIYKSFSNLNYLYLIFYCLILISFLLISSLNLKILLIPLKPDLPFSKSLKYYIYIWTIRIFFPANIGELSLLYFLKKEQIELGNSSALFLLEKLTTGLTGLLIAALGLFIFFPIYQAIMLILILSFITITGIGLFLTNHGRMLLKMILGKYSSLFSGFSQTFFYYLKEHPLIVILNTFFALIRWGLSSLLVYLLFSGFCSNVSFVNVLLINTMVIITALIPLSLNGIGIRETSAVVLFQLINLNPVTVTSVYLVSLFLSYLFAGLFLIFLFKELANINIFSISQQKSVPESNIPGKNSITE